MNEPLVSVIIPFYNRIDFTLRALKSAINQTHSNLEIIIINDGSTDDISRIMDTISLTSLPCKLLNSKNLGPSSARNIGIKESQGEYIAFLDSDDYWMANKIELQVKMMTEFQWNFSHTSYKVHDSSDHQTRFIHSGKKKYNYPWPAFHCKIATPTVMVSRKLIRDLEFNQNLRVGEDTLLWLKLSGLTTLQGIDEALAVVTTSGTTSAKNKQLKLDTFQSLNVYGMKNSPLLSIVHRLYIKLRQITCSL